MPECSPDKVDSVLQAFSPFLRSIDMRTIAVKPESDAEWENLVTSINISEKTLDEVTAEYEQLPKLKNKQIALFPFAASLDYSFFEQFSKGYVIQDRFMFTKSGFASKKLTIRSQKFNPLELKMVSNQKYNKGITKRVLRAVHVGSQEEREILWHVVQKQDYEANRLSYLNIMELIKDVLKIDLSGLDRKDFELTILDIAKIKGVSFGKTSMQAEINIISGLKDLQLNLVQKRAKGSGNFHVVWRKIFPLDEIAPRAIESKQSIKIDIQPPNILPFDGVELKLIHRNSVLILDETYTTAPLQNVIEPFSKILTAFCPIEEIKKMLLEPESCGKSPEKRFELACSWLLSLAGFYTVYLGAQIKPTTKGKLTTYEILRNEHSIQIGTADIIAYEDNKKILLVDCDIGALDDKKMQQLIETANYFLDNGDYNGIQIVPVLCTPKHIGISENKHPLKIVDGNVIENMLYAIVKGDRKSARAMIY